ncbi:M1 family peptidase [Sphingorhabdus pulchriflava]|uniref:M1 family peptidase n=1 Tax=Sphingorhabdus pulchriflava TaxID=2292257 RepID=A0A371B4B6_9SPHN|nr:M1 family metallopeptidase [Sphingorhabdus pulchriflava]RDV02446.1 M1 family peptidase [Sphingorhabdus pulchriflava]
MRTVRTAGRLTGLICALALSSGALAADDSAQSPSSPPWQISDEQSSDELYVPRDIQATYDKGTRSRDGKPGPNYWQNHSTHNMRITVSPPSKRIEGEQEIIYTNNSPDMLPVLIFRMYLNAHQPEAMRDRLYPTQFLNKGITVEEFSIDGKAMPWNDPANPLASINQPGSTVHGIALEKPLPPKGSVRIKMRWNYELTADGGWKEGSLDETSYFLAYFYPRITNYSDYNGWDYSPFTTGREFNNDFADFNVEVNAPRDFVVWATGDLQNPAEVLQPKVAASLKSSQSSDKVVTLAEAADVQAGRITTRAERLSWKWQASHVPDFAIAVSNHYRWQASSVVVDPSTGRRTSVQAAYPDSATDFKPMVETGRQAMQFASTKYPGIPYPWPKSTIVLGSADEEYPMMVNDDSNVGNKEAAEYPENAFTGFVATHEILHSWFPFYMGINEKRYPFMDEGWTTAFEYLRNVEVLGKESADRLFKDMRVVRAGWPSATSGNELPIITPHDTMYGQAPVFGFNQYGKAALGYLALKDLMGNAAFKKALHEFMGRWHGKRPLPWDMFNSFNNAGVGNHNWFFNNWFFSYNHMDIGIASVRSENGQHVVEVRNKGGMAMPFDVVLNYADGSNEQVHRSPVVWKETPRSTTVAVSSSKALQSVSVDSGIFVDFYPSDNVWKQGVSASGK